MSMSDTTTLPGGEQGAIPESTPNTPATPAPIWIDTISESTFSKGLDLEINCSED
jgi:hypothetical protein